MLAYDHGWKPAGTEPGRWTAPETGELIAGELIAGELIEQLSPDPETWEPMNYFSNDFQWVTDEDASNIADALEDALDAKPDDKELGGGSTDYLRKFITFCRAGAFFIY